MLLAVCLLALEAWALAHFHFNLCFCLFARCSLEDARKNAA